ncbi:hypothetical protein [Legionella longbeachae]|uniref:Uncharacterized protein n=1 Tax=Legionella longbeachae serogroup 1 (strain NSW150) TaxID=661367 RepID=D3HQ91_LEGLN|nr:hypothetical protein [Legionella longbeachae]VEE01577.1 Uncharacterised protein [Legionella oakridgensis]HBD7396338.1 hypothetical protein [Legionella pneumophila]ARB92076.1 hypothetical protein A6J40_07740 [Legionella longbeachae]ARM34742.1 hypothetical protein B0B39_14980 [Legionella longbeachae]EEZ95835.1 conserved hypothetical protein [Legionella longbeachae D-4968]
MLHEQEVSALIELDNTEKLKEDKKQISWADGKDNGKIDDRFLDVGTAASPSKKRIEKKIHKLIDEGYTEIEAASLVGKPVTPSGKVLLHHPTFYASPEQIMQQKEENNRYSFFSMKNIGLGALALGAAATLGIILSKNK